MSRDVLARFGISDHHAALAIGATWQAGTGATLEARSPIDGSTLATIAGATADDVRDAIDAAHAAFQKLRVIPAPIRGELVRRIGMKLRERKGDLADLVTLEAGKILGESLGEVQEMIDICDFAVGLSRQLHGLTIASERPGHRMMEQYHPLGVVGVISAFNFPVAVWAWNAMLGLVCGDPIVWKPSEKTPLTAIATHKIVVDVLAESADLEIPDNVVSLVIGGSDVGQALASSTKVPLISATGSTRMGREVGKIVAGRLGRSHPRARRQQRNDRRAVGRPGVGRSSDHLRGLRHGRAEVYDPPAIDRARERLRPDRAPHQVDRREAEGWRPALPRHAARSAD